MGVVYKAHQVGLDRIVALKMIRSGELAHEAEVERFHSEARAAAIPTRPMPLPQRALHESWHTLRRPAVETASAAIRTKPARARIFMVAASLSESS